MHVPKPRLFTDTNRKCVLHSPWITLLSRPPISYCYTIVLNDASLDSSARQIGISYLNQTVYHCKLRFSFLIKSYTIRNLLVVDKGLQCNESVWPKTLALCPIMPRCLARTNHLNMFLVFSPNADMDATESFIILPHPGATNNNKSSSIVFKTPSDCSQR